MVRAAQLNCHCSLFSTPLFQPGRWETLRIANCCWSSQKTLFKSGCIHVRVTFLPIEQPCLMVALPSHMPPAGCMLCKAASRPAHLKPERLGKLCRHTVTAMQTARRMFAKDEAPNCLYKSRQQDSYCCLSKGSGAAAAAAVARQQQPSQ